MKNLNDRFAEFLDSIGIQFKTSHEVIKSYEAAMKDRLDKKHEYLKTYASGFPLRPSSALACQRRLFYELSNYHKPGLYPTEPNDSRQERVYNAGHLFEEFELKRLGSLPDFKISHQQHRLEIAKVGDQWITGSIDALLWHKNKLYLLDIKSITTYQFNEVRDKVAPKLSNVAQLSLYACSPGMEEIKREFGVTEIKCALFYVNKDNLTYTLIEFDPNPNIAKAIIKRFTAVFNSYANNQIPPRDFVELRFPCSYCMFKDYCIKPDQDNTIIDIPVDVDPELSEEEQILALWQYGDAQRYTSPKYTYKLELLKTKWKLSRAEKEKTEEPKRARKRRARKV